MPVSVEGTGTELLNYSPTLEANIPVGRWTVNRPVLSAMEKTQQGEGDREWVGGRGSSVVCAHASRV